MFSKTSLAGRAFMLIVIAATLAVIPMLFFGNVWGHDFDLHLPRWMDAAQQFREGIAFPRWAAGSNSGFGDPFFIFYPPLSWTLGATLGSILPWKMVLVGLRPIRTAAHTSRGKKALASSSP